MKIQEAIQKAVEGGYSNVGIKMGSNGFRLALLDPLFWQAIGKSMGWTKEFIVQGYQIRDTKASKPKISITLPEYDKPIPQSLFEMHRLIDHLAEGKSIEEYFRNL